MHAHVSYNLLIFFFEAWVLSNQAILKKKLFDSLNQWKEYRYSEEAL